MKTLLLVILAASLAFMGCSSNEPAAPQSDQLNFDILGNDAPESYDAAMNELTELGVTVPDPISDANLRELSSINLDADIAIIEAAPLDEGERPNFRRIIQHLHEQFRLLQRCIENSDNRELRRVAYGAHLAFRYGLRAFEAGDYRLALRAFHRANRLLNLAHRICRADGGGRG